MEEKANMAQRYEREIPEGYEARIEGNKVIIEKKDSEDERILEAMIFRLGELSEMWFENIFCKQFTKAQILAYLEKQKEQKPAEWSEEDERIICNLIRYFKGEEGLRYGEEKTIDWLKSRRPQPHWKPSKEQMDALLASYKDEGVYDYYALESLYNDLQKLL